MKKEDKLLLKVYMQGLSDESNELAEIGYSDLLSQKAYNLGRKDYIVGDELKSLDHQTDETILTRIKYEK